LLDVLLLVLIRIQSQFTVTGVIIVTLVRKPLT